MIVQTFDRVRPKLMVVSHERSGTHFLMNALAKCYGYVAAPWINLDYELGLNFFAASSLIQFFGQFRGHAVANIVKSHHPFAFFDESFDEIVNDFHVFYIYRDPRDVMVSYWKFLRRLSWNEGPKAKTLSEFIRSRPSGMMMRYQTRQEDSLVHRWRTHVEGWTNGDRNGRITVVRYEDLASDYERVMSNFADILGSSPVSLDRPSPFENTVLPGETPTGAYVDAMDASDLDWIYSIAGRVMVRLGYDCNPRIITTSAIPP